MFIKSVIFDLDGTLVDSAPGIEYAVNAAIRLYYPKSSINNFRNSIGPPIRDIIAQLTECDQPELIDAMVQHFRSVYDSESWLCTKAYAGVPEILSALQQRNISSFVATNKPFQPAQKIIAELGLMQFIREIISPDSQTPTFKSKTEAVCNLIDHYDLQPNQTVLVGDSLDDAHAAQQCKLPFVAVTYGYGLIHQNLLLKTSRLLMLNQFTDLIKVLETIEL